VSDLPQCFECERLDVTEADRRQFLDGSVMLCRRCFPKVRQRIMAKAPPPHRGVAYLPSRRQIQAAPPRIVPAPEPVVMELARELSAAVRA
jgi:hypothetical protein